MISQKIKNQYSAHGSIPLRPAQGDELSRTAHHERKNKRLQSRPSVRPVADAPKPLRRRSEVSKGERGFLRDHPRVPLGEHLVTVSGQALHFLWRSFFDHEVNGDLVLCELQGGGRGNEFGAKTLIHYDKTRSTFQPSLFPRCGHDFVDNPSDCFISQKTLVIRRRP